MRTFRLPTPLLLVALAPACTCQEPPAPVVTAVRPAEAPNDADTPLVILGANLFAVVKADLNSPARSTVDAGFALDLLAPGGGRLALAGVTLVSDGEIHATLRAGALPGTYDLLLTDPRGRTAYLPAALLVIVRSCAGVPNGTPCDDGNACTRIDTCQGGVCVGSSPVACPAPAACHLAGTCDPATGLCSNPVAPDGTSCNDGNACTTVDACLAGVCVGSSPVVCAPSDACHLAGTCGPATGACSNPVAPNGTPCQAACASGDTCQNGVCTSSPGGCVNTAPLARLVVTPQAGAAGATVTFDATASRDAESPTSSLTAVFDFGDGFVAASRPATQTASHTYLQAGRYQASVRVTDPGGLFSYATVLVLAFSPSAEVKVTTAVDESDPNATPTSPGGTGLSLREAVTWVNSIAPPGPWVITFAGPMSISMTGGQRGLTLTAPGTVLAGAPGVSVDFGGFNQSCVNLAAPNQLLLGMTLAGCASAFVGLQPASQGSQVASCSIGPGSTALGVVGLASSPNATPLPPPASVIGPDNDIAGLDTGVRLPGSDYTVLRNRIHGCKTGVLVTGVRARLIQNRVYASAGGSGPNAGVGLAVSQGPGPVAVLHNLFDGNGSSGISASPVPMQVVNSLFTGNAGTGIDAPAGNFAAGSLGPNGFFGNALGPVSAQLSTGPGDVLANPLYVSPSTFDFRLLPASPAVDAGVPVILDGAVLDVNGPAPGTFNGLAPDLGPEETPYQRP